MDRRGSSRPRYAQQLSREFDIARAVYRGIGAIHQHERIVGRRLPCARRMFERERVLAG